MATTILRCPTRPVPSSTRSPCSRFLAKADTPRDYTGFWDLTSASMDQIGQEILASTEPLTPAQVLQIATDANGGNVSLGLLAAHNYLKDVAYGGRLQADPEPEGSNNDVAATYGDVATHLEPWRQAGPDNSIGRLDKMGSLYHIFAAAVAEVWFPNPGDLGPVIGGAASEITPGMGDAVTFGEQLMRIGFFTALNIPIDKNDVPDIEKARADRCGVGLGDTIITRRNEPPTPTTVATGQWRLVATNINPLDEPYDFVVGVTPNYYESPRFDGTFSKNTVSATAMVGRDRSVEREYQFYDMTTKVSIVGPPATMVPGKTITLEATGNRIRRLGRDLQPRLEVQLRFLRLGRPRGRDKLRGRSQPRLLSKADRHSDPQLRGSHPARARRRDRDPRLRGVRCVLDRMGLPARLGLARSDRARGIRDAGRVAREYLVGS